MTIEPGSQSLPAAGNLGMTIEPGVWLLCGHLELRPDEWLNSLFARQTQAYEAALAFEINVKIKKGAAFCFGFDPNGQLRD